MLVFVERLAGSIWVGGFIVIAIVTRIARRQLGPPQQVAFFRVLGRRYGTVGGTALLMTLAVGAILLSDHGWDGTALAATLVAIALVGATVAGVLQARGMTRLRAQAAVAPADEALPERVRRGASRALALRATIGALTLALLLLAAVLAS